MISLKYLKGRQKQIQGSLNLFYPTPNQNLNSHFLSKKLFSSQTSFENLTEETTILSDQKDDQDDFFKEAVQNEKIVKVDLIDKDALFGKSEMN